MASFCHLFKNYHRVKMKIIIALIILPLVLAAKKNFEIKHVVNCPGDDDLPMSFHAEVNNSALIPNQIIFSAFMEAKKKVSGPLELNAENNRCDLKSENCEKYFGFKVCF